MNPQCAVSGCSEPPTNDKPFTYRPDPAGPVVFCWSTRFCSPHRAVIDSDQMWRVGDLAIDASSLAAPVRKGYTLTNAARVGAADAPNAN